ncbi:MAG: cupin-like domain-containing protein, partial [Methylocystis sp.]|nr:cupin-like domain-containing protein [Methylocystis sp.]
LYMPPGTLHHVRSLEASLSFNVDWHTKRSALHGIAAALRGMPLKNVYYNALVAFGLYTGTPVRRVFPYYKSYLSYVS